MKYIYKIIILSLVSVLLFASLGIIDINAVTRGNFTMGFDGPDVASVGSIISVQVVIKDMSEGVAGAGATLNYDSQYLELVDKEGGTAMAISYNEQNHAKFLGVSVGSTVTSNATLVTYQFRALKEGTTSITLSDLESTNVAYQGMNITTEVYTVTITDVPQRITSLNYGHTIDDDYIKTVAGNTTGLDLKNQLDNDNSYLEIRSANDQDLIANNEILATGMIVKLIINNEIKDQKAIVIKGETTGEGIINVGDAFRVIQHALGNDLLSGALLIAGDTNDDGIVNVGDAFRIIQHALGNDPFVWL